MVSDLWCRCGNKTGKRGNQLPCLVKISRSVLAQSALHGSGAHEVNRSGVDDLNRRDFGNVASELVIQNNSFLFVLALLGYPRLWA
jgi:hypothetical protein